MPSQTNRQVVCVFHALILAISIHTLGFDSDAWAQGRMHTNGQSMAAGQPIATDQQHDWRPSSYRDEANEAGMRMRFDGIVDRLRQDPDSSSPPTLRPANHNQLTDQISQSLSAAPRPYGQSSNDDRAISLRPQSIGIGDTVGVQPASFQSPAEPRLSSSSTANETIQRAETPNRAETLEQWSAGQRREAAPSFLEREQSSNDPVAAESQDMVSRIGINLVFVLAIAIGGILLVKQFYRGNLPAAVNTPAPLQGLKISQVLRISRHVQLYLVDGAASKVLVAVDAGGIKSVNVLPGRFEDALDEPEAFSVENSLAAFRDSEYRDSEYCDSKPAAESPQRGRAAARAAREVGSAQAASSHRIDQESSSDIDEKLIKMLLSKSSATT